MELRGRRAPLEVRNRPLRRAAGGRERAEAFAARARACPLSAADAPAARRRLPRPPPPPQVPPPAPRRPAAPGPPPAAARSPRRLTAIGRAVRSPRRHWSSPAAAAPPLAAPLRRAGRPGAPPFLGASATGQRRWESCGERGDPRLPPSQPLGAEEKRSPPKRPRPPPLLRAPFSPRAPRSVRLRAAPQESRPSPASPLRRPEGPAPGPAPPEPAAPLLPLSGNTAFGNLRGREGVNYPSVQHPARCVGAHGAKDRCYYVVCR